MKLLVIIITLVGIIASFREKGKRQGEQQSSKNGKTIFDDWASVFSSDDIEEKNLDKEEVQSSFDSNENINNVQTKRVFKNTEDKKGLSETVKNNKQFNLKKAVIYSAVLDNPYK